MFKPTDILRISNSMIFLDETKSHNNEACFPSPETHSLRLFCMLNKTLNLTTSNFESLNASILLTQQSEHINF